MRRQQIELMNNLCKNQREYNIDLDICQHNDRTTLVNLCLHQKTLDQFENSEFEALLSENSCQTQEELAELLELTQQAISKCLKAMEMIQKQGNWVPYESTS